MKSENVAQVLYMYLLHKILFILYAYITEKLFTLLLVFNIFSRFSYGIILNDPLTIRVAVQ